MDQNDRQAIEGLFTRLKEAEMQAGPRDQQADDFIHHKIAAQPAAPYLMAQTIVMQEQALEQAQQHIEQLEYELSQRQQSSGGFFSSLFGNSAPPPRSAPPRMAPPPPQQPEPAAPASGPWSRAGATAQAPQSGGFLAGAAQTAMGVAGGVLLGNAVAGMFGADKAHASENNQSSQQNQHDQDDEDDDQDDGGDDESFFDF